MRGTASVLAVAGALTAGAAHAEDITLTVWSHEADSKSKVAWRELAARNFEEAHPGVKVKITWYQKEPLFSALNTALRAGQGPDAFYIERDRVEYITNGFVTPLNDLINWSSIKPWTKDVWTIDGKTYAVPQEVWTLENFFNETRMAELGITLPDNKQLSQTEYLELVKKSVAAGISPLAAGAGDRPYPGAYMTQELLLKRLGVDDYRALLDGKISYTDPRVIEVLGYVHQLVEAGFYPKSFTTMTLAETWPYFEANPAALMLIMGSFYAGHPFTSDVPDSFKLGVMKIPALDNGVCNECKTAAVGASFAINSNSEHKELVADFLNEMATPEMGARWVKTVLLGTAVETGPIESDNPKMKAYLDEYNEANQGAKYFIGAPHQYLTGSCKEAWAQIINVALPANLISIEDTAARLDQACYRP
ncbi:MAG: extracellular solute-binding protein [Nitratireductor sp.]|nr:extracellular solute-binding protein [Nitratireductor sp.]